MLDLFDSPLVPGLEAREEFVTSDEERALIEVIDSQALTPFQFQQWTGKRLTCSFGWSYDFQSGALDRADPMPEWLHPLRDRAADLAGLEANELVQALLIRYDPGAGIGWHRDRPIYEHVIGISLGAPATMRLRRKVEERWRRVSQPLAPRSAYHLAGEVRHEWEHSIAPMDERRYSITFRTFSERGRRLVSNG
jgi:alkylated DNA repair dioxygenase AlkB